MAFKMKYGKSAFPFKNGNGNDKQSLVDQVKIIDPGDSGEHMIHHHHLPEEGVIEQLKKGRTNKSAGKNMPLSKVKKPKLPTRKHNVKSKKRRTGKLQSKKSPMKLAPAVAIQLISAVKDKKKPTKNFFARDNE